MLNSRRRLFYALTIGSIVAAGCSGSSTFPLGEQPKAARDASRTTSSYSPIKHVVMIVQENRSFNNLFATFPHADGTTTGNAQAQPQCGIDSNETMALQETPLVRKHDLVHTYQAYTVSRDNGNMDGFDAVYPKNPPEPECTGPYEYVNPSDIQPYWYMATHYALAEHMFTTEGSNSFTAHQDLIRGGTIVQPGESLVDTPTCGVATCWWGCDAPLGTKTSLISEYGVYAKHKGPFPCSNDFASNYLTLRDLLDGAHLSWKYYTPGNNDVDGRLFTAFDVVYPVRDGNEWGTNVSWPQTNVFNDIAAGTLPAVSWVIPVKEDSDHPGVRIDNGPSWVASIVNAIGQSSYWNSTAIVITWDDWGGFYDNLNPQQLGYGGLGFRVPAIVVSPYAKPGYLSPTYYEFGSIIKYIEENWNLGSLGTTDERATSIVDCFNYAQAPRPFKTISSAHTKAYFLHRKGRFLPPDTDM